MNPNEDYELWLAMNEGIEPEVQPVVEAAPAAESTIEVPAEPVVEAAPEAAQEEPLFELSPSLIREPQTNTIVVQPVDPLTTGTIITDTGEVLMTGSIELPLQPTTGSIEIVQLPVVDEADNALAEEFAENYVGSIAPVRASGVMNSRARASVLPIKTRRGESQTVLLGVISVLMATVGALFIAAYWLGVI